MRRHYLDPGENAGLATFSCGKLSRAILIRNKEPLPWWPGEDEILVVEYPKILNASKQKGKKSGVKPESIVRLANTAGRLTANVPLAHLLEVYPSQWKGTIDPDIVTARVLERLTPEERSLIPKLPASLLHNVLDAVGLGLWDLGRMRVGGGPCEEPC